MTKCIVQFKDRFININADRLEERDGIAYAYDGQALVGIFDLGAVDRCYLSNGKDAG